MRNFRGICLNHSINKVKCGIIYGFLHIIYLSTCYSDLKQRVSFLLFWMLGQLGQVYYIYKYMCVQCVCSILSPKPASRATKSNIHIYIYIYPRKNAKHIGIHIIHTDNESRATCTHSPFLLLLFVLSPSPPLVARGGVAHSALLASYMQSAVCSVVHTAKAKTADFPLNRT